MVGTMGLGVVVGTVGLGHQGEYRGAELGP